MNENVGCSHKVLANYREGLGRVLRPCARQGPYVIVDGLVYCSNHDPNRLATRQRQRSKVKAELRALGQLLRGDDRFARRTLLNAQVFSYRDEAGIVQCGFGFEVTSPLHGSVAIGTCDSLYQAISMAAEALQGEHCLDILKRPTPICV